MNKARQCAPLTNTIRNMTSETGLDRIDYGILRSLQNNARLSNKELAAHVGLAPSSCLSRVRRLRETGVLRGFHADIDPAALGVGLQAIMLVRLSQHRRKSFRSFHDYLTALPEVVAFHHVAGVNDFIVHVAVRDSDHLRDLAIDSFTTRPEVAHHETSLIFETIRGQGMPNYNSST